MKRILVRAPNWIGDQILAYPFYRMLRDRHPKAWITVVCPESVQDIQFKGLIDEVLILPKKRSGQTLRSYWKLFRFARFLKRKGPWDLSILLPNSFGSALVFRLAGARARRGYIADARGFLLNEGIAFDPSVHRSESYLRLLTPEGGAGFEAVDFWVKGPERDFDPYVRWPEAEAVEPPEDRYFIVAPGSNAEARRWDISRFAELMEELASRRRLLPVVVGGPRERALAEALKKRGIRFEDHTGKGTVASLWKLFQRAEFAVCNDSGLAHVAALCGCPVQIVWGAGDPKRTRPIGPAPVQLKIHPVECWPCERNGCRFEDERRNQCLKGIRPGHILEEIENGYLSR